MDWAPLVSTSLGAVIGIASTLATDQVRTRRGRQDNDQAARRQLYGDYLAALARTRNQLRMAARPAGLPAAERARRAAEAFHEGNAYELRYQIAVVAPRRSSRPPPPRSAPCATSGTASRTEPTTPAPTTCRPATGGSRC